MKTVRSSNLALRFYKCDGWTEECLRQYLICGDILDTELAHFRDPPDEAYFVFTAGSRVDLERLYEQEVSVLFRAFDDRPWISDIEFMRSHL